MTKKKTRRAAPKRRRVAKVAVPVLAPEILPEPKPVTLWQAWCDFWNK